MAQPVSGLTGLAGLHDSAIQSPEGTPEETFGGPAQPHAETQATIYPWQNIAGQPVHGPYSPAGNVGDSPEVPNAGTGGTLLDETPNQHAAPWPKGITSGGTRDAVEAAYEAQASYERHGADFGAKNARIYGDIPPPPVTHLVVDYTSAGDSMLDPGIPRQMRGQRGFDRVQGFQVQNTHGFDSAHVREVSAMPGVPGNYFALKPGGRPLLIDPPGGNVLAGTGQDSAFAGQDPAVTFSPQGATLVNSPAQYEQPPEAYVGPPVNPTAQEWGWPEW